MEESEVIREQYAWLGKLQEVAGGRPIKVQHHEKDKWHTIAECNSEGHAPPIHTRGILRNEVILDFDYAGWDDVINRANKLIAHLESIKAPFMMTYTGGKGIHIHLFLSSSLDYLDDALLSELADQEVDVARVLRETVFDSIVLEAGLEVAGMKDGKKVEGLDRGKVSWRASGEGSQIRMVGTPRPDGRCKTLISEIPRTKPEPRRAPCFPKESPRLWDYAKYQLRVKKELIATISRYKAASCRSVPYEGQLNELPCCQRLLEGMQEGARDYGALTLALFCNKLNLKQAAAKGVIESYISKCEGMDQEHARAFMAKVDSVYSNGKMPSCEWVGSNLGICQKAKCPLEKQRRESFLASRPAKAADERQKLCDKIIDLAEKNGLELYRDASEQAYASYVAEGHREIWPVGSQTFERWLRFIFYKDSGKGISRESVNEAISTLEARARFEGEFVALSLRVAQQGEEFWYCLSNSDWSIVRISPEIRPYGWEIVQAPRHAFRREEDMLAVPCPTPDGSADAFWRLINLPKDDDERLLLQCHIISFLIPNIPHAIQELYGRKGAAKTDMAEKIKLLLDPSDVLKFTLDDPRNVNNILDQHYIAILDNVSKISRAQADKLCRAVDGESSADRRLCTNRGQERYKYQRCLIITSVEAVGSDLTDLAQRTCLYQLPFIDKERRRTEGALDMDFQACRASTLGHMFTIVAKAMGEHKKMMGERMRGLPRLADFCIWGEAIARALGNPPGRFEEAYFKNINLGIEESINSNPLAQAIIRLLEGTEEVGGFAATADVMLMKLSEMATNYHIQIKGDDWPKAANKLSAKIANIVEDLREIGIIFEKKAANELDTEEEKILTASTGQMVSKSKTSDPSTEVQRGQRILLFKQERMAAASQSTPSSIDSVAKPASLLGLDDITIPNVTETASVLGCYDTSPTCGEGEDGFEQLIHEISVRNKRAHYFEELDPKNKGRISKLLRMGRIAETADGYLSVR